MSDSEETITKLQERIDRLEAEQRTLREDLTTARVEQLQGRIEDLELQAHLATMEANDRVSTIRQDLVDQWRDAKTQVARSKHTAADVLDTVRSGVDSAIENLREALVDARRKTSGHG